jgi:cytochrome c556
MLKRWMQGALAATVALSFVGGVAVVAQAQTDIIKARQDNRKEITRLGGREMRALMEPNGNLTELAAKAERIAELNKQFGAMFPPGSDKGDTLASPAIWTDRAGFDAVNKESVDAALKMAELAKAGNRAALADQYKVMGANCGACHQKYTTSDPFKK